jgi:hypothetical protein
MLSWSTVAYGAALSAVLAAVLVALLVPPRRIGINVTVGLAADGSPSSRCSPGSPH